MSDYGIKKHVLIYHRYDLTSDRLQQTFERWCEQAEVEVEEKNWQTYHDQFLHFEFSIAGYIPHEHAHLPVMGNERTADGELTGHLIPIKNAIVPPLRTVTSQPIPKWRLEKFDDRYQWGSRKYWLLITEPMVPRSRGLRLMALPQPTIWDIV